MGYVAPTWQNGGPPALNAKNMQDISDNLAYVSNNMVNPNLLDNWYFGNPVNQRGQTSYTGTRYGIDRWKLDVGESVTIDNGLNLVKANSFIGQYFDDFDKFVGRQLVGSVLMSDGNLYTGTYIYNGILNQGQILFANSIIGMYIQKLASALTQVEFNTAIDNVKILAAKLEPGSQQTLAHKEYGDWVLNEIPKFGDQLAECQRYCVAFNKYDSFLPVENNDFVVELPVPMRATPTIVNPQNIVNANVTNPTVAWYNIGSNQLRLRSTASHGGLPAVCNGLVLFSADL